MARKPSTCNFAKTSPMVSSLGKACLIMECHAVCCRVSANECRLPERANKPTSAAFVTVAVV